MYVDESGDLGLVGSATSYFALSGLVIHESRWRDFVTVMKAFRQTLRATYGLPVRLEIHAYDYMRSPPVPKMPPHVRLAILRNMLDEPAKFPDISITNVVVRKTGKPATYDVFENGWRALFQRFENTLKNGNFPGAHRNDHGLVFTDATNGAALSKLMRTMAVHNPVPNQGWAGPGYRLFAPVSSDRRSTRRGLKAELFHTSGGRVRLFSDAAIYAEQTRQTLRRNAIFRSAATRLEPQSLAHERAWNCGTINGRGEPRGSPVRSY